MLRSDGRGLDQIRPIQLIPNYVIYPEGSVLIELGKTKVLCNASIVTGVPRWMQSTGKPGGWITAEYALLPRSTHTRTPRETEGLGGRTQEIRRLVGRSLRAAFDLEQLGEHTCILDCDVLQADGGTRTAAITGGYVALRLALQRLIDLGTISNRVFLSPVAAISVGVLDGVPLVDLCYEEDSAAEADVNIVMNEEGKFIELQGTAEGPPFSRVILDELLDLAAGGILQLFEIQAQIYSV